MIVEVLLLVNTKNLLLSCIYATKVFLTIGFNGFRFNIKLLRALYFNWYLFFVDLHHDLVDIILASKKPWRARTTAWGSHFSS